MSTDNPEFIELKERVLIQMRVLARKHDKEREHRDADDLLCEIATAVGCEEIVAAYAEVGKWYA